MEKQPTEECRYCGHNRSQFDIADGIACPGCQLMEENDNLKDRIAELEKDKDRLDWWDEHASKKGCGWIIDRGKPVYKHWSQEPEYEYIREAVDAARESA